MKSDHEIWKESLNKGENADLFKVKPGGRTVEPIKLKRDVFKSPAEKKLEERIKVLEKQVKNLVDELKRITIITENTVRRLKTRQPVIEENE